MGSKNIISDFAKYLKLSGSWQVVSNGLWISAVPEPYGEPRAGFKIRINFNPYRLSDAAAAIKVAAAIANARRIPIKILATIDLCKIAYRKNHPVEAAGKFITLYPGSDTGVFAEIAQMACERLSDAALTPTVHPVSDAALTPNISFRYGAYTDSPTLMSPEGECIPDRRDVFTVPDWIELPPWIAESIEGDDPGEPGVVFGRYRIISCLHRTLSGAVYHCTDIMKKGTDVVIKEARPYITTDGVLATRRLSHEAEILRYLQDLPELTPLTPPVEDLFFADAHAFLVMPAVMGNRNMGNRNMGKGAEAAPTLFHYWQRRRETAVKTSETSETLMRVAQESVWCLKALHANKVAWRDFRPVNLLVVEDDQHPPASGGMQLRLIDAEYAVVNPTDTDLFYDRQALGRLLLWLVSDDDAILDPHTQIHAADFQIRTAPAAYLAAAGACFKPEHDVDAIADILQTAPTATLMPDPRKPRR